MAGPWEKYQSAAPSDEPGPWTKYAEPDAPTADKSSGVMDVLRTGLRAAFPLASRVIENPGETLQGIGNLAAGAVRGAGSIGATILAPIDIAKDAIAGKGLSLDSNRQRRADIDAGLQSMGAQPDSLLYKGGKLGGEIAGTAGVGGVLANAAARVPGLAAAAPNLLSAIRTSGMTAGEVPAGIKAGAQNLLTRIAGGAATGGAAAGLVEPDQAGTGAAVGGGLPVALKMAGAAGGWLGSKAWDMLTPEAQKRATQLAQMTGQSLDDMMSALRQQGPSLIPGSRPTVPQILQDRNISQVARTLKSSGQNALGEREAANGAAQLNALERVAPTAGTINEARANVGNAIESVVRPAEKAAGAKVNALFDAIDPNQAKIQLPLDQMQSAADKYAGRGYFGKGKAAVDKALAEAGDVGSEVVPAVGQSDSMATLNRLREKMGKPAIASDTAGPQTVARSVPFDELQNLRSSIGEAITDAQTFKRRNAVAALTAMKNEIDNKVGAVAGGEMKAGEVFTPEAVDAWGQALAAHAAKQQQFHTGPQAAIFRTGADGLPAKEGAEIAPMFWNAGNAQIENMQAFKRLTAGDQNLVRLMKSNATTEALQQGAKGPNEQLTFDAFNKWMKNHSGAAKELFTDQELSTLKAIQDETRTAAAANSLGRADGSNTAQNIFSMGALGSPKLAAVANNAPLGIKYLTGPLLSAVKGNVEATRNATLSNLLANPLEMANALEQAARRGMTKAQIAEILNNQNAQQMLYRSAPVTSAR